MMAIFQKIQNKLAEFARAERKLWWLGDQLRWRYFAFRHRKQAQLNVLFDRDRGVETAAEVPLEAVGVPRSDVARGNVVYRPLTEEVFRASIAAVPVDTSKFTFVDIGSGKGKVLFMAADHPFRRIVGIEYALGLHHVAMRNIAAYRSRTQRCRKIEAIHGDALEYTLPSEPLVLFTFNALAKEWMRQLARKLDRDAAAIPGRPLFMIYTNVRNVAEIGDAFSELRHLKLMSRMRKFLVLANDAGHRLATGAIGLTGAASLPETSHTAPYRAARSVAARDH